MTTRECQLPFAPDTNVAFVSGFVMTAGQFSSKIELCCGEKRVNAKSILGVMYAGVTPGAVFTLWADGPDEAAALDGLSAYMEEYRSSK